MNAQTESSPDAVVLGRDYLVFSLAGVEYGIDYKTVLETRRYSTQAVHAVEGGPHYVKGSTFVAGATVPVIDLKKKLAIGGAPASGQVPAPGYVAFVRVRNGVLGILVDQGFTVVSLQPYQISDTLPATPAVAPQYLVGSSEVSFKPLLLMDLETVVTDDDVTATAASSPD